MMHLLRISMVSGLLGSRILAAAPGSLAPLAPEPLGVAGGATASQVAPDGSVYLMGDFTTVNGSPAGPLVRLSAAGTLDPAYAPSSRLPAHVSFTTLGGPRLSSPLFLTADGALIVSGLSSTVALTPSGARDARFDEILATDPTARPLFESSSGLYFYSSAGGGSIHRYKSSTLGTLPLHREGWPATPLDAALASDGSLWIVGGDPSVLFDPPAAVVFHVTADGSLFEDSAPIPLPAGYRYGIDPLPGGGFRLDRVAAPLPLWPSSMLDSVRLDWLSPSGDLQRQATLGYAWSTPRIWADEADGSLLYTLGPPPAGLSSTGPLSPFADSLKLARLRPDGTRDPAFEIPLEQAAIQVLPDGRIQHSHVRRILPDGTADPSWTAPTLEHPAIHSLIGRLNNGRILSLAGDVKGGNRPVLLDAASLLPSPGFTPPANLPACRSALVLPDGSLLLHLATEFALPDQSRTLLLRLTASGEIHPSTPRYLGPANGSFSSSPPASIYAVQAQPSGKLLVQWYRPTMDVGTWGLQRLSADGTVDPGFQGASGFSGPGPLLVLKDGSFFLGDRYFSIDGAAIETLPEPVSIAAGLADGSQLLVSSTGNDLSLIRKWRPASGGGLDTSFANPFLRGSFINRIVPVDAGKVVVSGQLLTASGPRTLVRLHTNGMIDPTFRPPVAENENPPQPGSGEAAYPVIFAEISAAPDSPSFLYLPESQLLVAAGHFNQVGGSPRAGLAALNLGTASGYAAWAAATLPDPAAAPDDDFDHDGASNYLEYCVGSDPAVADPAAHRLEVQSGDPLIVALPRNPEAPEATPKIEVSSDLIHWQAANGDEVTLLSSSSGLRYTFSNSNRSFSHRFTRVRFDP